MSHLTIHFPDEHEDLVIQSLCRRFGYRPVLLDENDEEVPNPISAADFAKARVVDWIKSEVRKAQTEKLITQTEMEVESQVDSIPFD